MLTHRRKAEIEGFIRDARKLPAQQAAERAGLAGWPDIANELLVEVERLNRILASQKYNTVMATPPKQVIEGPSGMDRFEAGQVPGGLHADDTSLWRGEQTEHPTPEQATSIYEDIVRAKKTVDAVEDAKHVYRGPLGYWHRRDGVPHGPHDTPQDALACITTERERNDIRARYPVKGEDATPDQEKYAREELGMTSPRIQVAQILPGERDVVRVHSEDGTPWDVDLTPADPGPAWKWPNKDAELPQDRKERLGGEDYGPPYPPNHLHAVQPPEVPSEGK